MVLLNTHIFLLLCSFCQAYKFLFYQISFSPSHVRFVNSLVDVLVEDGHTVDILNVNINPNKKCEFSRNVRRVFEVRLAEGETSHFLKMAHDSSFEGDQTHDIERLSKTNNQFCKALLNDSELIATLKFQNYDSGFVSLYTFCPFGLFHLIDVKPTFGYTSVTIPSIVPFIWRTPAPPSYVFNAVRSPGVPATDTTLYQRLQIFLYQTWLDHVHLPKVVSDQTEMFRGKQGADFPSLDSLASQMAMYFVNSDNVADHARPITHKISYIGGIQASTVHQLEKKFSDILSSAAKGTVLFSFGSLTKTSSVPKNVIRNFLNAFSRFPDYKFIWKYDDDEVDFFKNHSNVFPSKWVPQNDLLHSGKIAAFITHAGQNSYIEACHAGVPMIAVPLFLDQHHNAAAVLSKNLGVKLDRLALTEEAIIDTLEEVLNNPKYTQNAKEMSKAIRTRPFSPKEVFLKNVKYTVENPKVGDHFQLPSVHLPLWQLYSLDVIFVILTLVLGVVVSVAKILSVILRKLMPLERKIKID
ncbi:hypothetical protein QR680_008471 [Steinernema hermaphroditum]|uniref:glucuronosyltransferase n=1 Tax=Steinernema hermaphroditum TaxID=289476 RepID=A0AA39II31_9BILA|nr:hypothetical protein QR680_008471 [Steinernema hermaphroditum]